MMLSPSHPNYLPFHSIQPTISRVFRDLPPGNSMIARTNSHVAAGWKTEQSITSTVKTTNSGVSIALPTSPETTRKSIHELRRLSGLTWEQLARLLSVSRRSLHFWASGQPLSRVKEEQLNRILGAIQFVDRGSARANRTLILQASENGYLPFDLLVTGEYETFKQMVGAGNPMKSRAVDALSSRTQASRMPPKPEDLVDALQDPIHHEIGQSRPIKATRRTNRDG